MPQRFKQIQATMSMEPLSSRKHIPEVNGYIQGSVVGIG